MIMFHLLILSLVVISPAQISKICENQFPFSVELLSVDGQKVNSETFLNDGKFVFIDFWNIHCGPCMQMFDAVRDNIDEWNVNTNCKIIAIAAQERDERTLKLISEKNWPIEIYFDPDYNLFRELCKFHDKNDMRYSFPTVFVFDNSWQIIDKLKGAKRKWKDGYKPKKGDKITHKMLVIDLEYYYKISAEWIRKQ